MSATCDWSKQARFYQFYPLGFAQENGLQRMREWLPHVQDMNFNALYLSPVWKSHDHGYETIDYGQVDPRLGNNQDLKEFVSTAHDKNIRVVLDGVFNHVGRDFFAFQDVLNNRENSLYQHWFVNIIFDANNHHNDGLSYECWEGHESLVMLNVTHPDVRDHLLLAVDWWVKEFGIDGLRLDAADCVDMQFWQALRQQCDRYDDFWLMGEIIHGDYRPWLSDQCFHSVTNYEVYKGLWSSFNDTNMHEVAYSLNRQFGQGGIYEHQVLYNFVDNHDVARIASTLENAEQLFPLYLLMYLIPGIPSVYYGSEWKALGKKDQPSDWHLRPSETELVELSHGSQALKDTLIKLNNLREAHPELASVSYDPLMTKSDFLSFKRGEEIFCLVNASAIEQSCAIPSGYYVDVLNGTELNVKDTVTVDGCWGRMLVRR